MTLEVEKGSSEDAIQDDALARALATPEMARLISSVPPPPRRADGAESSGRVDLGELVRTLRAVSAPPAGDPSASRAAPVARPITPTQGDEARRTFARGAAVGGCIAAAVALAPLVAIVLHGASPAPRPVVREPGGGGGSVERATLRPSTLHPSTLGPSTLGPSTLDPTLRAATAGLATAALETEVRAAEVPATEVPATDARATEVPATEEPATEVPATEARATEARATEARATGERTTEEPATEVPATEEPATEEVAAPAVAAPAGAQTAAAQTATTQAAIAGPALPGNPFDETDAPVPATAPVDRSIDRLLAAAVEPAPAPAPRPAPADAVPEVPSRDDVDRALEPVRAAVRACAQAAHGTASVRLTVLGASGRVTSAIVEGDLAGTPTGSCVARAVRGAEFRTFARERFTVLYPFRI